MPGLKLAMSEMKRSERNILSSRKSFESLNMRRMRLIDEKLFEEAATEPPLPPSPPLILLLLLPLPPPPLLLLLPPPLPASVTATTTSGFSIATVMSVSGMEETRSIANHVEKYRFAMSFESFTNMPEYT